jgi:hypothetical protein
LVAVPRAVSMVGLQVNQGLHSMIAVLNLGRLLMVGWIVYGLVLIFAPALLHRSPDQVGGAIQVGVAFGLGWLLDRARSMVRTRRRASREGVE